MENGRKITRGLRLWTVAVDGYKAGVYRRLWLSRGDGVGFPAGWAHVPEGLDAKCIKQLRAEQLVQIVQSPGDERRRRVAGLA